MGSLVLGRGGALGQHAFGRVAFVKPFVPWRSAAAVHMKAADAPEASALKEDRFYTNDVIAEIATLPSFLQDKPAERWLSEVVAKLALRGCGREEVAWLLSLPVDTINEELPASAGEEQLGSCLLDLAFVPRGAGCGIFGSNSSPQLNERRCTLCRDLSGVETHALVVVEARDGDPPGEYQDAMLIARKNLRFDSIPSHQLTEASQWPNVANMPIPAQEEVQAPSALLGEATPSPACLCTAEALQWLLPCVARLWAAKACVREEIAFLMSLPAEKLGSALPSLGAENLGKFLQDLSFVPQGACCRVEGSTSNARLNGLEGTDSGLQSMAQLASIEVSAPGWVFVAVMRFAPHRPNAWDLERCSETRVEGTKSCAMLRAASKAEVLCQQVWQVPAEERTINFEDFEGGEALRCSVSDGDVVRVLGWEALRLCDGAEGPGVTLSLEGRLPLWWTPAIKALWLPLRVGDGPSPEEPEEGALNLHRLFLSASRVALQWRWPGDDKATTGPADGWPLPLSILADGVKIEICPSFGKL
ncbi:unnamed protein product [Symbiodinium microadriaticum]|nr:unnamed protein product [Symbiodinium microadriaticum]